MAESLGSAEQPGPSGPPAAGTPAPTAPRRHRNNESDKDFWDTRVRSTLRLAAAAGIEADLAIAGAEHPNFVRAFESGPNDFALILPQHTPSDFPQDQTSRLFMLWERKRASKDSMLVPIDAKSFNYYVAVKSTSNDYGTRVTKHLKGTVHLTPAQAKDCQALIISSMNDRNWVAFVPRFYYEMKVTNDVGGLKKVFLGRVPVSMAHMNPLPPVLAPFVMHKDHLPMAFDNLLAHVEDPHIRLCNPYSGLQYRAEATVHHCSIQAFCPADSPEIVLRHKLWKAFDDFSRAHDAGTATYRMNNPLCSPWTSDLRLDHRSGTSVFIELKQTQARVSRDGETFSHRQRAQGRGIFTFTAPWDYLLTMIDNNNGYLVKKDDISRAWWHQDPGTGGWLVHKCGTQFLRERRIDLNAGYDIIVNDFVRIISQAGLLGEATPIQSQMTASEINQFAGKCPVSLLERFEKLGSGRDEGGSDTRPARPDGFATHVTQGRQAEQGGVNSAVDAELFIPLMDECRRVGLGCMIDLGKHHPFGRMAMVDWAWSQSEKERYDRTGIPPCWTGMLGSSTPMVVLINQWCRWRVGYAPEEGTQGEVNQHREAHPCIMVLSAHVMETANMLRTRWVIPSEFMEMVQIGALNGSDQRAPLFLDYKQHARDFVVTEYLLHAKTYEFLCGQETVYFDHGRLAVDPSLYLKTIGDFKHIGESQFERCAGEGKVWNKIINQRELLGE